MPILLYKPKFIKLQGKIIISSPNISTGMIQLGRTIVPIYPNKGIIIENRGIIEFKGACEIGNNSALCIGEKGKLTIGEKTVASTSLKIVCFYSITLGKKTRIGWDCTFMDTDFHKMTKLDGSYTKGYGAIKIGNCNWFGTKCHILKRTETPDYCTVSATTLLNKKYDIPPYSVIGGNPATQVATGLYRNVEDDVIEYK